MPSPPARPTPEALERAPLNALDWAKGDGLLPAIVQHADSGRVLMLGYMNRDALARTLADGRVTFWSRSRETLWQKGETSGHVLDLVAIEADCDRDTLLLQARPAGPVCHLGTPTCFGDPAWPAHGFLGELAALVQARRDADPDTSYTARLLQAPVERVAQKVGEEGVETALAATLDDPSQLAGEAADLLYHLLVLLARRGLDLDRVVATLQARHAETA
jgi:phosphoribosyl-ATP pyrophosphohydrolase/phosphoribosyl-AMP cyclohydrolase